MPQYTKTQFLITGGNDNARANYLMIDPAARTWSVQQYCNEIDHPDTFESVVHNRLYALRLSDSVDAEALARGMIERKDLLGEVFDGYTDEWQDTNLVGKLNANALEAFSFLENYATDANEVQTMEVSDMDDITMSVDVPSLSGITAQSSDNDLDRIAGEIEAALSGAGYAHYSGIPSTLERYRQDLRETIEIEPEHGELLSC